MLVSQLQNATMQTQLMTMQCACVLNWDWIPDGKQKESFKYVFVFNKVAVLGLSGERHNRKGREAFNGSICT